MPIVDLAALKGTLAPRSALLGIDVGAKTLGLAISDPGLMVAAPLMTIRRTRFMTDAERLAAIVAERGVGGFVVGLPVSMDGTEGPACQSVRQVAANLLAVVDRPLAFWDERLSTRAIERMLVEQADLSRRKRAVVVDKLAAAWILQGALDWIAGLAARGDGAAR